MYGTGYDPHAATLSHLTAMYPIEMHDWPTAAALPPYEVAGTAGDSTILLGGAPSGSAHLRKPKTCAKTSRRLKASTKNSPPPIGIRRLSRGRS